jgi:hypothetical protein
LNFLSASLDSFVVVLTCSNLAFAEGSAAVNLYQLQSVASFGRLGTLGYVERSVSASIEK